MLDFDKINSLKTKLSIKGILIELFLEKKDYKNIACKASLKGRLERSCDFCAQNELFDIDEDIELILYRGIYEGKELFPLYECLCAKIDLEEVMSSELELILHDNFYCKNCIRSR